MSTGAAIISRRLEFWFNDSRGSTRVLTVDLNGPTGRQRLTRATVGTITRERAAENGEQASASVTTAGPLPA